MNDHPVYLSITIITHFKVEFSSITFSYIFLLIIIQSIICYSTKRQQSENNTMIYLVTEPNLF